MPLRAVRFSVAIALVTSLLSFVVMPVKAAATTCYVVTNGVLINGVLTDGVLTDGSGCSGAVVIDSSVTVIGQTIGGGRDQYGAFEYVTGVTSVTIPATVTSIGYAAFRGASNLESVTFASSSTLSSIGQFAFSSIQKLKTFTVPSSVTSISSVAFAQSGIREFTFEGAAPSIVWFNGPGLQNVNYQAVGFVTSANEASFKSPNPLVLNNIAVSGVSPPIVFSPQSNDTMYGQVGSVFTGYDLSFTEAGTATASVSSGALPPGLTLNSAGQLRGTPTTAGTYTVAFTVTAGGSRSRTVTGVTLQIAAPNQPYIDYPSANSTITRRMGNPINISLDFYPNNGVITKSAGNLPTGVTLNSSGVFSGTPTVTGTYTFSLTITDSYSQSVTNQDISILVLPAFTGNVTISASRMVIAAPDGGSQTQYSMIESTAPSDFKLGAFFKDEGCTDGDFLLDLFTTVEDSEYTNTGLPSNYSCSGTATYVFRIYDSTATTPNFSTPYLATVTVEIVTGSTEIPIISYPTTGSSFSGQVGTAFSLTMTYNSGVAPEATTVTSGALPPGLSLSSAGRITGTPTTAGTYTASLSLTDNTNARSTVSSIRFVIAPESNPSPPPVPYLRALTPPLLRLQDGKLMCSAGTYNAGFTVNGVIQGSGTSIFTPSSYTYNVFFNGVALAGSAITTSATSASWAIPSTSGGAMITCSVAVSGNSTSNTSMSSENATGVSAAATTQVKAIAAANASYSAIVKENAKTFQKTLVENRTAWRKEVNAIRAEYSLEIQRIISLGSNSLTSALLAAAVKKRDEAQAKIAADYAASKTGAVGSRELGNKVALDARNVAVTKANAEYATFVNSKGFGVFIP